jgi:hypothetical protein
MVVDAPDVVDTKYQVSGPGTTPNHPLEGRE